MVEEIRKRRRNRVVVFRRDDYLRVCLPDNPGQPLQHGGSLPGSVLLVNAVQQRK
jgi:hypothetical protein